MNIDDLPSVCGIYSIRCMDKEYIGASVNVKKRVYTHFYLLKKGTHSIEEMQKDFNEEGEESFSCSVLCVCEESELRGIENLYLSNIKFKPYNKVLISSKSTKERKIIIRKAISGRVEKSILESAELAAKIENRSFNNLLETALRAYSKKAINNQ